MTDTAFPRLVDALIGHGSTVKPQGERHVMAQCPAHPDGNPSLSVTDEPTRVLLYCHTGCNTEDVVQALGLTMADLYEEPRAPTNARGHVVARYPYCDADGRVLFEKLRLEPKDFRVTPPGAPGRLQTKVLYNLPAVRKEAAAGGTVYVVEGEKDANRLNARGYVATCNYEGAAKDGQRTKWRHEYSRQLDGATVVIVADRDAPGYAHARAALQSLQRHNVKATVVQARTGNDVSDHLAAGHDVGDLVPVPPDDDPPPLQQEEEHRRPAVSGGPGRPSAATELVALAEDRYTFGISFEGEQFALPKDGPQIVRMLRGTENSLRAELANAYCDQHGKVPPQQALADALLVLEGKANTTTPAPLHLRVARDDDGKRWLDLGDHTGSAVRITADGWEVVPAAPVLFRRTALTAPLPTPQRGGDLDELWALLNVTPQDRALLAGVLVASLEPDISHPVIDLNGEQGTGKTTAGKTIVSVLDPSTVPARQSPKDLEQWTTAAAGSWWVGLDNLSGLPDWLSDALCRASTGDGAVRRKLYSDGGLYVVRFQRCVVINGIDLGVIREDLADRLVTINLDLIPDDRRRYEAELARTWTDAHPRILGAVLDLAAQVQDAMPNIELTNPPRMADFARILAAVDHVLHTQGLARYRLLAGELAADAVTGDPVLAALAQAITGPWTGTSAQLLDTIDVVVADGARPAKTWPKDARALTGVLRRRAVSLRRLGWTVEDLGRGGAVRALRWHIAPPVPPEEAGNEAGNEAGMDVMPASMPADACLENPALTCEDGDLAGKTGKTGTNPPTSLCRHLEMEGERGPQGHTQAPQRDGAEPMPVLPVSPAECPHGTVGGALPDPFVNGLARCPQCRQAHPREAS